MGFLPEGVKRRLRRREDGRDVVGIRVSWKTIKFIAIFTREFFRRRRK